MTVATIVEMQPQPWGPLTVEYDSGERVAAHVAGAFALRLPRLRVGERVEIEPSASARVRILRRAGPVVDA